MSSKGSGTSLTQKSYRLTSDSEKPKVTGIVNEDLLNDYLQHIFPSLDEIPSTTASRYSGPLSLKGEIIFSWRDYFGK
uniref:Uncharacterized protein n=1 Tax=Monodelphis domestica TaxID=13616 RepID=A0A5F8GTK2_MONDO